MCDICNLIKSAKSHDKDSIMRLLVKFESLIKKYSYYLNYEDSENDLIVFFIQLIYEMPNFRNDGQAVNYINQSIRHAYIKLMKKQIKKRQHENLYDPDIMSNMINDSEVVEVDNLDVIRAVEQLNDRQKRIIKCKYYYRLPDKAIMEQLRISRQTIYINKNKALEKLRQILGDK